MSCMEGSFISAGLFASFVGKCLSAGAVSGSWFTFLSAGLFASFVGKCLSAGAVLGSWFAFLSAGLFASFVGKCLSAGAVLGSWLTFSGRPFRLVRMLLKCNCRTGQSPYINQGQHTNHDGNLLTRIVGSISSFSSILSQW
jgi:hypothetical protein